MKRAKELRAAAWEKKKGRWGMLALVFFIYSLIMAACAALSYVVVGAVAVLLLSGPLMLGFTMVCLAVSRRQGASLSKLFEGFSRFGDSLVLFLLMDIFIFLWSLLLIIPGIIKMYSYSMSWFVLHDRPDLTGNEARKRSMYLMRGHKWRLFCLDFSFLGWYLLSALNCPDIVVSQICQLGEILLPQFLHQPILADISADRFKLHCRTSIQ